MDTLNERISEAHRRLVTQQWLGRLGQSLAVMLSIAMVAIALPRFVLIEGLPANWDMAWIIGSIVTAFIGSGIWSYFNHTSRDEAAVEVDLRYDLRERAASSLLMTEEQRATEAGAALVEDARQAVERIEVSDRFELMPKRRPWLPLIPSVLAFMLIAFVGTREAESRPEDKPTETAKEEVKEAIEKSRKQLSERRKEAEKKGLKDATGLLKDVEKGTKDLAKLADKDKTKAMVKLNDLADKLEKKRQELGGAKALRRQMNQMKDLGKGPAEKAAQAMQQGNWKRAADEIAKMQKDMKGGKMSKEQQKKLAQQLGKMQKSLKQAVQQQQQKQEELKKQLEAAQRNGNLQQASKLQQKLDQMQQQMPQMQAMQKMAQQMQQAQQAMQNGDANQAQAAMQQMANQLQQMQQDADAMEMLDAAMTDIQMCKDGMCDGKAGIKQGMKQGQGMGQGKGQGQFPGQGMGEGMGTGFRPDEKHDTNFRDTQVKQNVGRGGSTFGGLVDGPSIKGTVTADIKQELNSESVQPADPLTSERLPRSRREHAEEYFRKLREEL